MGTNAGAGQYKKLIDEAREIAATARADSSLSWRIRTAAFTPHPRTGMWMSNTPSCHRAALKELITSLGVISILECLYTAIDMNTNRGSVACYRSVIERARDMAEAIDVNPELPARIEAAAFKPFGKTGIWMPNTP